MDLTPEAATPTVAPTEAPLRLPKRRAEMLRWTADPDGYTYKEIPDKMKCHLSTLRTYHERIAKRYGIKCKAALVAWAVKRKVV